MNSKILLFALLGFMVVFNACKENDAPDQSVKGIPLIKTMVSSGKYYEDSVYYEYDAKGRVIKTSSGPGNYAKYTYSPGKITIESINITNRTSTVTLNEIGLAKSIKRGAYTSTLEYDSNGYLVVELADADSLSYSTISDGNTIKRKDFSNDPKTYTTNTYLFLTNINTIGNENKGITWWGKQDKNLPSKETEVFTVNNTKRESVTDYIYEYDTQDRVIKKTVLIKEGVYVVETYTYY